MKHFFPSSFSRPLPLLAADGDRASKHRHSGSLRRENPPARVSPRRKRRTFEETIFALGHIEVLPGKKAIVSSRIPGRAFSVIVVPHQEVDADAEVAWVESRQPGDPPPTIKLEAPISGMVSKVNIAQGQPISPDQELIEIIDLSTVEASAQVPQHLVGKLQPGAKAHIRINALPDRVFEAKLAHIAAVADEVAAPSKPPSMSPIQTGCCAPA
jgi:biotin carboxyl carrier protein